MREQAPQRPCAPAPASRPTRSAAPTQAWRNGAAELQLQAWGHTAAEMSSVGRDLSGIDERVVVSPLRSLSSLGQRASTTNVAALSW